MRAAPLRAAACCAAALVLAAGCGDRSKGAADSAATAAAPGAGLRPPENPDPTANRYAAALEVDLTTFKKSASGLYIRDDKVGTGAPAKAGDQVRVHYEGFLTDGKKFDGSRDSGKPYQFTIGQNEVIKAWDEGIAGMRVGGRRTLVSPPGLGYGATGAEPDIPANAVLVFKVELEAVR
jgi:FKBP-type peptidyl-prolyl cis-trans isomerase